MTLRIVMSLKIVTSSNRPRSYSVMTAPAPWALHYVARVLHSTQLYSPYIPSATPHRLFASPHDFVHPWLDLEILERLHSQIKGYPA
jgi:hypothetical protein